MCTKKELKFSVFLIYNLAENWKKRHWKCMIS